MEEKKNLLTYAGLKKLEEELHDLKGSYFHNHPDIGNIQNLF